MSESWLTTLPTFNTLLYVLQGTMQITTAKEGGDFCNFFFFEDLLMSLSVVMLRIF